MQNVFLGVHLVFDQLDDGDDEVVVAVPAEDVVEPRAVLLLDAAVDVFRERGQQCHGYLRVALLDGLGETEDVRFADVVHRQDEVVRIVVGQYVEGFARRTHPRERGRIRQVEVQVLLVDLRFDVAVFFEYVAVVAAAYQQDFVYPVLHEAVLRPGAVGQLFFAGLFHRASLFRSAEQI